VAAGKREFSGEKVSLKLREVFKRNIYRDKCEELYKVYKVRSSYMNNGESKPMLALLTDKTLYLSGKKGEHTYSNQFVIPYNELDVIMVSYANFHFPCSYCIFKCLLAIEHGFRAPFSAFTCLIYSLAYYLDFIISNCIFIKCV
jgi:hypothetical protein